MELLEVDSLFNLCLEVSKKLPRKDWKILPKDLRSILNEKTLPMRVYDQDKEYYPFFKDLPLTNVDNHVFSNLSKFIFNKSAITIFPKGNYKALRSKKKYKRDIFYSKYLKGFTYYTYDSPKYKYVDGLFVCEILESGKRVRVDFCVENVETLDALLLPPLIKRYKYSSGWCETSHAYYWDREVCTVKPFSKKSYEDLKFIK